MYIKYANLNILNTLNYIKNDWGNIFQDNQKLTSEEIENIFNNAIVFLEDLEYEIDLNEDLKLDKPTSTKIINEIIKLRSNIENNKDFFIKKVIVFQKQGFSIKSLFKDKINNIIDLLKEQIFDIEFSVHNMKIIIEDDSFDKKLFNKYLESIKEAYAALKNKKLEKIWYGTIIIKSKKDSGTNRLTGRGVPGRFLKDNDIIYLYNYDKAITTRHIIHELGHRYWYKFMNKYSRSKFNDFVNIEKEQRYEKTFNKKKLIFENTYGTYPIEKNIKIDVQNYNKIFKDFANTVGEKISKIKENINNYLSSGNNDSLRDIKNISLPDETDFYYHYFKFKDDPSYIKDRAFNILDLNRTDIQSGKKVSEAVSNIYKYQKIIDYSHYFAPNAQLIKKIKEDRTIEYYKSINEEWANGLNQAVDEYVSAFNDWFSDLFNLVKKYANAEEGKANPVSEYGGYNISEAFAEAFKHYVLDMNMNQRQIEVFKEAIASLSIKNIINLSNKFLKLSKQNI